MMCRIMNLQQKTVLTNLITRIDRHKIMKSEKITQAFSFVSTALSRYISTSKVLAMLSTLESQFDRKLIFS